MKKVFTLVFLIIFFISTNPKTALGVGLAFGGRIATIPSVEIIALASTGSICFPFGFTITVIPAKLQPVSYYIPFWAVPRTPTIPHPGQSILGKYLGILPINCINASGVPFIIALPAVTLSGTSEL